MWLAIFVALPVPSVAAEPRQLPADELQKVFQKAALEDRGTTEEIVLTFAEQASPRFQPWSLEYHWKDPVVLRRSAAMEDLAWTVSHRWSQGKTREADAYLKAAAEHLKHHDPKQRALAAEFLALLPLLTLDQGYLPLIAALANDDAPAFQGAIMTNPQFGNRSILPEPVTVRAVASVAISSMCPYSFTHSEIGIFDRWWPAHRDVRNHPWYWGIRWQKTPLVGDLPELEKLPPEQGLRMLLLVSNNEAVESEAARVPGLSERQINFLDGALLYKQPSVESEIVGLFVLKHKMKDRLFDILRGEIPWVEARGQAAADSLIYEAMSTLKMILTAEDVPVVEQTLATPRGALERRLSLQTELIRLAARTARDRHEQILVSQLQRDPGLHLIAGDLIEQYGAKHWPLVQKSYTTIGTDDKRHDLIPIIQEHAGQEARKRLGELFALDDLTELERPVPSYRGARFVRYVDAANKISGEIIVSEDEKQAGSFSYGGKGGKPIPGHNAMVPENRRKALDKLRAFFNRPE